jgi:hypothetical protein
MVAEGAVKVKVPEMEMEAANGSYEGMRVWHAKRRRLQHSSASACKQQGVHAGGKSEMGEREEISRA